MKESGDKRKKNWHNKIKWDRNLPAVAKSRWRVQPWQEESSRYKNKTRRNERFGNLSMWVAPFVQYCPNGRLLFSRCWLALTGHWGNAIELWTARRLQHCKLLHALLICWPQASLFMQHETNSLPGTSPAAGQKLLLKFLLSPETGKKQLKSHQTCQTLHLPFSLCWCFPDFFFFFLLSAGSSCAGFRFLLQDKKRREKGWPSLVWQQFSSKTIVIFAAHHLWALMIATRPTGRTNGDNASLCNDQLGRTTIPTQQLTFSLLLLLFTALSYLLMLTSDGFLPLVKASCQSSSVPLMAYLTYMYIKREKER